MESVLNRLVEKECHLCTEDFDEVTVIPMIVLKSDGTWCSRHPFCQPCLEQWIRTKSLADKNSCPFCKCDIDGCITVLEGQRFEFGIDVESLSWFLLPTRASRGYAVEISADVLEDIPPIAERAASPAAGGEHVEGDVFEHVENGTEHQEADGRSQQDDGVGDHVEGGGLTQQDDGVGDHVEGGGLAQQDNGVDDHVERGGRAQQDIRLGCQHEDATEPAQAPQRRRRRRRIEQRNFVCERCGRGLKTMANLRRHRQQVHRIIPPRFRCQVCDSLFTRNSNLQRHYAGVHPNYQVQQ